MEYQIGDFSTIARLSIKTLRYYHDCGLLLPVRVDRETGYRYYDEKALERVKMIQTFKNMEFALKDIKEIMDKYTDDTEIVEFIVEKSQEINEKMLRYTRIQKELEVFITSARQDSVVKGAESEQIHIRTIPDQLVAALRFQGKYNEVGKTMGKLFKVCGNCVSAPFSMYYDEGYKEDADIETCVPIKNAVHQGEISSRILKGGKAATYIHKGPYEEIGASYRVLIDYIRKNNIPICKPSREVYLKGPGIILPRSPKKFLTEIQMFLAE